MAAVYRAVPQFKLLPFLAQLADLRGDREQATAHLFAAVKLADELELALPGVLQRTLALGHAERGELDEARGILGAPADDLADLIDSEKMLGMCKLVHIYAMLDERELAAGWLEKAQAQAQAPCSKPSVLTGALASAVQALVG